MIGVRKFLSMPAEARQRKLWRILHDLETALRGGDAAAAAEIRGFLAQLPGDPAWPSLAGVAGCDAPADEVLRLTNRLRHDLGAKIGAEAAEWDLFPPPGADAAVAIPATRLPLELPAGGLCRVVYCDDIRSPFNLGSIFRSAWAFGLQGVVLSAACPDPLHSRCRRSAMGGVEAVPWVRLEGTDEGAPAELARWAAARGLTPFALELGGTALGEFSFPERGLALIGSEELGLHPALLDWCRGAGGVASIPLPGSKASLNVGVSFGVLAAAWTA